MSEQRLVPTREELGAIVEKTESFLDYLREAVLIAGIEVPPIPPSTIPYRKANAVSRWAEWEQAMNPSSACFGGLATGTAAGGWPNWRELHLALVDLDALRDQLISHWALATIVGAKSVRSSFDAAGKPGSGETTLVIHAEDCPSSASPKYVQLEKPLDWPPPVPHEWSEQCRYALERIKKVMDIERSASTHRASNPDGKPAGKHPTKVETVVLLVHGIRDFGHWQAMVTNVLQTDTIKVRGIKYGYFDVLRFLAPFETSRRQVERVQREIRSAKQAYPDARVCIIAHSFGGYIISRILADQADISIWRLILCGTVIKQEFRWELHKERLGDTNDPDKQQFILNECGSRDIWPVLGKAAGWGYGAAGTDGFGSVLVLDRFHNGGHGLYFRKGFVRKFWKPFIESGTIVPGAGVSNVPTWIRMLGLLPLRWIPLALSIFLVALVAYFGVPPVVRALATLVGAKSRESTRDEVGGDRLTRSIANLAEMAEGQRATSQGYATVIETIRLADIVDEMFPGNQRLTVPLSDPRLSGEAQVRAVIAGIRSRLDGRLPAAMKPLAVIDERLRVGEIQVDTRDLDRLLQVREAEHRKLEKADKKNQEANASVPAKGNDAIRKMRLPESRNKSSLANNPRHIDLASSLTTLKTVAQNWSDDDSNQFYNIPSGSRLLPYKWFLCLEQEESETRFCDAEHIRDLGYIPRVPDPSNPDGLPIGFINDAPYDDGMAGVGMTCAACHTSQINYQQTALVIDGGPTMGDFGRLQKKLTAALLATAVNDAKFGRFAAAVLTSHPSDDEKAALRARVRSVTKQRVGYNERNLPKLGQVEFGPGRVDAFGAIFNEVSVTFLGVSENWQAANAPVSYPCLWDTPQHDRVQWNGTAENRVSALAYALSGTSDVGALGRNSIGVLGVFGSVDIDTDEALLRRLYVSTVNRKNLIKIEESLKSLWSPKWPTELFGPIDSNKQEIGEALFKVHCAECHDAIDRSSPDRRVLAQMRDVDTDDYMARNFGRIANTGPLEGQLKTLLGSERFAKTEPMGAILNHIVERVNIDKDLTPLAIQNALAPIRNAAYPQEGTNELNPNFQLSATIVVGSWRLSGQVEFLVQEETALIVGGGRFRSSIDRNEATNHGPVDLSTTVGVRAAAEQLKGVEVRAVPTGVSDNESQTKARLPGATVSFEYKARPLNGIWATAPYLHNGSVPNLYELLMPSSRRVKTFRLGTREFDPVNVGFRTETGTFTFDTSRPGNSNRGHDFDRAFTEDERRALIEYMKSL